LLKPIIDFLEYAKIIKDPSLLWFLYQMISNKNIGHRILSKCIHKNGNQYSWKQTIFQDIFFKQTPLGKFIWGVQDSIIPIEHIKFYEKLMRNKNKTIELFIPIENATHIPIYKDKGVALANSILQAIDESVDFPKFDISRIDMINNLFKYSYYGIFSKDNFVNRELLFLNIKEVLCINN
jgi:hypothetical protein